MKTNFNWCRDIRLTRRIKGIENNKSTINRWEQKFTWLNRRAVSFVEADNWIDYAGVISVHEMRLLKVAKLNLSNEIDATIQQLLLRFTSIKVQRTPRCSSSNVLADSTERKILVISMLFWFREDATYSEFIFAYRPSDTRLQRNWGQWDIGRSLTDVKQKTKTLFIAWKENLYASRVSISLWMSNYWQSFVSSNRQSVGHVT